LGRKGEKADAHAIAVVQIDSPAIDAALKEIGALPEIAEVRGIKL
jgi:hypothetical protein